MGNPKGKLYTIVAYDNDGNPVALRVNATGELMTVVSGGSGSGNPAEAKGRLITPVAFDPDLVPVALETDEYGQLKVVVEGITGGYTEGARVTHASAQSIPASTWTVLLFDTERWDTDTIHDTVTNNSRLTCKTAGKYEVKGHCGMIMEAQTLFFSAIILNGVTYYVASSIPTHTVRTLYGNVSTIIDLSVNDYVEYQMYHDNSVAKPILSSDSYSPEFMMHRIG